MVATFTTALVVACHATFFLHAGGLWRDEANSAAFATMPSLARIWSSLRHDSVPLLSTLVFRAGSSIGLGSDLGLRAIGLLIGCSIWAAFWFNARFQRVRMPAASILLVAMNPFFIRYGDAVRPMGLGILAIVLTFAFLAKTLREPSVGSGIATIACAVLGAHALYHDAILVMAIGVAGAIAMLSRGAPRRAAFSAAVALVAPLSLVVYLPALRAARAWLPLIQNPLDTRGLWYAMASPSAADAWLWIALVIAGLAIAVVRARRDTSGDAAFAGIAVVLAIVTFLGFMRVAGVATQPWYWLPLMALVAAGLDVIAGPIAERRLGIAIAVVLGMSAVTFFSGQAPLRLRQTNVDLAARTLNTETARGDLVVAYPFYIASTMTRYYRGAAPWTTLPPLEDTSILRYDLVQQRMRTRGANDEALERIAATLKRGGRVWLVGGLPDLVPGEAPADPAPAPHPQFGWSVDAFETAWGRQALPIFERAASVARVPVASPDAVASQEDVPVHVFSGWK